MNNMVNKIINSNKLYTLTILASLVVCACLSRFVESKPSYLTKYSPKNNQTNFNTQSPITSISDLDHTFHPTQGVHQLNSTSEDHTSQQNDTQGIHHLRKLPYIQGQYFNFYDYGFIFRLFVFVSAFGFVIFISLYVKSLNSRGTLYGYLDTRCGDEEKLMKHDEDWDKNVWDDDDEVVMFDALDFKKEHYKD